MKPGKARWRQQWAAAPWSFQKDAGTRSIAASNELAETFHACRKAAEHGDAAAQCALGLKFYYGEWVPKNVIRAHMWWNLAANSRAQLEKELREQAYDLRWCLEQEMTQDQIAEARRLAREWESNHTD